MPIDARIEKFEVVEVLGIPALFSDLRIDRETVPKNLFCYDIRHQDEDWGAPATIEAFVMVNHYGAIITKEPFDLGNDGYLPVSPEEFAHDVDYGISIDEWQKSPIETALEVCEGYEITERISVGKTDFVIGHHSKAPNPYVTWQANKDDPHNFFWGHYMNDRLSALEDLSDRVKEQVSLERYKQPQVKNKAEPAQNKHQKRKKHEPER